MKINISHINNVTLPCLNPKKPLISVPKQTTRPLPPPNRNPPPPPNKPQNLPTPLKHHPTNKTQPLIKILLDQRVNFKVGLVGT